MDWLNFYANQRLAGARKHLLAHLAENSANSVISSLENDTEGELTCLQPHSIQFLDQILSPQMRIPFEHLHGLVPADGCNFLI